MKTTALLLALTACSALGSLPCFADGDPGDGGSLDCSSFKGAQEQFITLGSPNSGIARSVCRWNQESIIAESDLAARKSGSHPLSVQNFLNPSAKAASMRKAGASADDFCTGLGGTTRSYTGDAPLGGSGSVCEFSDGSLIGENALLEGASTTQSSTQAMTSALQATP